MHATQKQSPAPGKRVGLFVTCLTDQFYPRVGIAVTEILRRLGFGVDFPIEQTCCGQPFFNNGFMPEADKLARRFIDLFEPFDYVVTPSGSCCAMVREQFHQLFPDTHPLGKRSSALAHRTFEFVEFLQKVAGFDPSSLNLKSARPITYHFTCHLRGLGIQNQGVDFLRAIGGVDFKPLEKSDQCCGFGGTFAIKYPQISQAMVQDKVDNLRTTGAKELVCNDAGCTMNISGMCHRGGLPTRVTHIAELIAEAMDIPLPEEG
jgi:L-lactate dehydrogenase complex protein LldE